MKITVISDTHNQHRVLGIPKEGDVIIHSGDCTSLGRPREIEEFLDWYGNLDYSLIILVPGNHDFGFEKNSDHYRELCEKKGITLLNDSGIEYEGIRFWGSPVTPEFNSWAFNRSISNMKDLDLYHMHPKHPHIKPHWDKIPLDIDVLITHGPSYEVLDLNYKGMRTGCPYLAKALKRVKPLIHVFGHIHESRGIVEKKVDGNKLLYINASSLDGKYRPREINHYTIDCTDLKEIKLV